VFGFGDSNAGGSGTAFLRLKVAFYFSLAIARREVRRPAPRPVPVDGCDDFGWLEDPGRLLFRHGSGRRFQELSEDMT